MRFFFSSFLEEITIVTRNLTYKIPHNRSFLKAFIIAGSWREFFMSQVVSLWPPTSLWTWVVVSGTPDYSATHFWHIFCRIQLRGLLPPNSSLSVSPVTLWHMPALIQSCYSNLVNNSKWFSYDHHIMYYTYRPIRLSPGHFSLLG